ncbi:hypothetical protein GJW-30_1_02791 [Variibacter gotjawalensis]|uniref:Uncharacterized protein n=1 Tax=Variibacter gotjawalensis TaxID=1333996 RepID=A0A0S3PWD7_9BRAD|nr:hypothetical protein [Variibacter gotjawalensis]NIK46081.1 hypothetical protein [Variibacter gotjawalensis]RZS47999.1 hypothetical protein EV661_0394 [Variibacter gotjawalensis]BAT60255.1 hypothetical protein GJW-30_1_02791 [Variibacter gotjawalensis]
MRLMIAAVAAVSLLTAVSPASALTMKECSAKYKEAEKNGTLGGKKWNEFRKSECGAEAAPAPATTQAAPTTTTTEAKEPAPRASTPAPAASGDVIYPAAVAEKYVSEKASKARMHTCLDQYKANKASSRNGGLNWIQKGGGYYSECNKRLKGSA